MVTRKNVASRELKVHNRIFSINSILKAIKEKIKEQGYTYNEKKHVRKSGKYGEEAEAVLFGFKEVDDYTKAEVEVSLFFHNIKKIKYNNKDKDQGDAFINIKYDWLKDYKNYWGTTKFNQFLYKIYADTLMKEKHKALYKKKIQEEDREMLAMIKKEMRFE